MSVQDDNTLIQEFMRRKKRQVWAIVAAIFLLVALLWRHSHPGLVFGEISRDTVIIGEIIIITGFVIFSASNWRCPACRRYLGPDIGLKRCRKCGTRFHPGR